jgi:hypothetical protein
VSAGDVLQALQRFPCAFELSKNHWCPMAYNCP